jgi:hypothetical protein
MKDQPQLSPEARALIDVGRSAQRGSPADRARIEAALRARLGPEALPAADSGARTLGLARGYALTGVAIGVCALAGVALWALHPHAHAPAAPPALAAPGHVPIATAPVLEAPVVAAQPLQQDRTAQEVALLARATRELRAGHAGKALKALDEHARRFPNGVLSEERRSARAQALCALGRRSEGRGEVAQLPADSPAAARATQACETAPDNRD